MTPSAVYFCPECGSPSIERSALMGGGASCRACSWTGLADKLAAVPVTSQVGGDADLLTSMISDLRALIASDIGVVLVRFLNKWGFLTGRDQQTMGKQAGRYMSAAARAIMTSVLEERDKMEVERARGS